MRIKRLKVENFRNLEKLDIEFSDGVNIIYGNNAQGKTNIIEAIYIFSFGKSFRANRDIELLKFDKEYFLSNIEIMKKDRELEMDFGFDKISNKKMIKVNGVIQKKISDIIGKLNVVVFKPEDIKIVTDAPSVRRKYIDYLISSISKGYLENITKYKKVLEERNNLLKEIKVKLKGNRVLEKNDEDLFDIKISDESYSTSNQGNTFVEIDNQKYGHILSPKTGYPGRNKQIGIVTKEAFIGDVISTGLYNQTPEKFFEILAKLNREIKVEGYMIDENGKIHYSEGFLKYVINE